MTSAAEPPSGEPIKIGILTSITSNFAPWGLQVRDGAQLAVDEINAAGGVDGRPLELVIEDDQNSPEEAVPAYERLVEEGVVAVGGIISSSVGGATAPLAESNQIPTFLVKSGDETILTPDSRFTFRTCLPAAPMVAGPIIEYAQENGLTKIGAIVADYPWGHAFEASIETAVAAADGIELQLEVAPVPEQDFTTYLRAIDEFGPDLLVATGHPPGGGPIIAQSNDLGMDVPVIGAYSPWALVMGGAGDVAIGRYADFDCADYQSDGVPGAGTPLPGDVVRQHVHGRRRRRRLRHRDDDRRGGRRGRRRPGGDRRVAAHAGVRPARLPVHDELDRVGRDGRRAAAVLDRRRRPRAGGRQRGRRLVPRDAAAPDAAHAVRAVDG